MFGRKTTGSVLCRSCGVLVGVNDDTCYNCGKRNPSLWGYAGVLRSLGADMGFVPFVMTTCTVVYLLTLVAAPGRIGMNGIGFFAPDFGILILAGASGAGPVFGLGRWWTVLSAAWLHGSALHILVNMMSLRQLGPAVADIYGAGRMVIIYTGGAIGGFALSSIAGAFIPPVLFLSGSNVTIGASASIAGLLGAILYYGHRSGSSMARSYATQSALMLLIVGAFMRGIDNYAHIGGFGAGYVVSRFLDPLKPERANHIVIALVCLAASMLSILASVALGLKFLER